eukprot:197535-Rhodomonas_salina.1
MEDAGPAIRGLLCFVQTLSTTLNACAGRALSACPARGAGSGSVSLLRCPPAPVSTAAPPTATAHVM